MTIDRHRLRGAYARLKGMQQAVLLSAGSCPGTLGRDCNNVVKELAAIIQEPVDSFLLPNYAFYGGGDRRDFCDRDEAINKLNQILSYLEFTQHVGTEIVQLGSIYNSIQDEQLKARCADLLSAPANFDRVINQATLVLEDRIRTKSGSTSGAVGVALVNEVIKGDPAISKLQFSSDKGEQDGYASILRGIVGAYRNPTHHHLLDHITREEALKICAFIDGMLKLVDGAVFATNS